MAKPNTIVSPKGEFGYSHLVTPSQYGSYDVQLILEGEEADKLLAELNAANEQAKKDLMAAEKDVKKRKALESFKFAEHAKMELDESGDQTGRTIFTFSNKAEGGKDGKKFKVKIDIVDAKKKPIIPPPKIGRGTIGKIAYQLSPYAMPSTKLIGVSRRLKGVQILELKEYGGGGADAFSEEEGYEAPTEAASAAEGSSSDDF